MSLTPTAAAVWKTNSIQAGALLKYSGWSDWQERVLLHCHSVHLMMEFLFHLGYSGINAKFPKWEASIWNPELLHGILRSHYYTFSAFGLSGYLDAHIRKIPGCGYRLFTSGLLFTLTISWNKEDSFFYDVNFSTALSSELLVASSSWNAMLMQMVF